MIQYALITALITALTELQVDKILDLVTSSLHAIQEAIKSVWIAIAPIGIAWLTWRQHVNKKNFEARCQATRESIEENTAITAKSNETLDKMAKLRGMVTAGLKPGQGEPIQFVLELPGYAYEKFTLSEGAPVLWKSEPCDKGRKCRFAVAGEARMGFHGHDVSENLTVVTGVLEIATEDGTFHIGPGQEFTSPPNQIHAVGFCGFGEVVAHWPEQETNELVIRIYQ